MMRAHFWKLGEYNNEKIKKMKKEGDGSAA